jgi:hypothetical protein
MVDRIHPLKIEGADTGGTQEDEFPTAANPNEDFVDARGSTYQNDTSDDDTVRVSRDASDNLTFQDGVVSGVKTLTDVLATGTGISAASHKILRQLIHFIDDGPAEGFVSGAYREVTTPGVFPDVITWWESSGKLKKIVDLTLTWAGVNVTAEQWRVYDTDGSTVLATVTDTIAYSGVFETYRTRAIA